MSGWGIAMPWSTTHTDYNTTTVGKPLPAYVTHTKFEEGDKPPIFPSNKYQAPPTMYNPRTGKKNPGKLPPIMYNPQTGKQTSLYNQTVQSHTPIIEPPPIPIRAPLKQNEYNPLNARYLKYDTNQMKQMEEDGLTFGGRKRSRGKRRSTKKKRSTKKRSTKRRSTKKRRS